MLLLESKLRPGDLESHTLPSRSRTLNYRHTLFTKKQLHMLEIANAAKWHQIQIDTILHVITLNITK